MDMVPDCFDLNDWVLLTRPEVYRAVRYLSPTAQYAAHLAVWEAYRDREVAALVQAQVVPAPP